MRQGFIEGEGPGYDHRPPPLVEEQLCARLEAGAGGRAGNGSRREGEGVRETGEESHSQSDH